MDSTTGTVPPVRRNNSWSLRRIVHDVSGQPLEAFQDPSATPHPYVTYVTTGRLPQEPASNREEDRLEEPEPPRPRTVSPPRRAAPPTPQSEPALDTEPTGARRVPAGAREGGAGRASLHSPATTGAGLSAPAPIAS